MKRAGVLGSPVAHSLSPLIHNAGYVAAGLTDWHYTAHECREHELSDFVASLDRDWAGLSLTMPLKEVALSVADEVSDTARSLGAANTLTFTDGRRIADNTDVGGMIDALAEVGLETAASVAILGAGGTARAGLGAAVRLGASEIVVYARRRAAFDALLPVGERLGVTLHFCDWSLVSRCADADLVISTVPKGVSDTVSVKWRSGSVMFDVLYDPWPTPLAATALAVPGVRVVDGLSLLVAQAARQFVRFTGVDAPVMAMRRALEQR